MWLYRLSSKPGKNHMQDLKSQIPGNISLTLIHHADVSVRTVQILIHLVSLYLTSKEPDFLVIFAPQL